MSLEKVLAEIERYCDDVTLTLHPRLKWRCYGELRIRVTGGEFKIESEIKHATALSAAQEMLERVEACLKDIHKAATTTQLNSMTPALEAQ